MMSADHFDIFDDATREAIAEAQRDRAGHEHALATIDDLDVVVAHDEHGAPYCACARCVPADGEVRG